MGYVKLIKYCASPASFAQYGFLAKPAALTCLTLTELVKISTRIRKRKTVQKLQNTYQMKVNYVQTVAISNQTPRPSALVKHV